MLNKKFFCLISSAFLLMVYSHTTFGQCKGTGISSFELQSASYDNAKEEGQITVSIQGGEPPFIFRLIGDRGGKGKIKLKESLPTTNRTYTFESLDANGINTNIFYQVEVESSNQSQGNIPAAICRKRIIQNIEVK